MTASASGTIEAPGRTVTQKAGLNRAILDAGWGQFTAILTAKAESAGRRVILVNPAYTSIDCHALRDQMRQVPAGHGGLPRLRADRRRCQRGTQHSNQGRAAGLGQASAA